MEKKKDEAYERIIRQYTPKSDLLKGCLRAFWVGGMICCIGQGLNQLAAAIGLAMAEQPMFTSSLLVIIGTTLTGMGIYDRIGKYAGAGSIVPITGFANSMAAPAIEFHREGLVQGIGTHLFSIAGPVLAYGIATSTIVGVLYWLAEIIKG